MKAFEKYKHKCCLTCTVPLCIEMCGGCIETSQRKIGWKEALEWTKKQGYAIEDETDREYSQALIDVIQRELES